MSRVDWIVCERTSRWASALRMALVAAGTPYQLCEIRHFSELDGELASRSTTLAAVEIHRRNFVDVLTWLSTTGQKFAETRCVALLDRSLSEDFGEVCDALTEAGAVAIVASPRRLAAAIAVASRMAEAPGKAGERAPLLAEVWTSLPWQVS